MQFEFTLGLHLGFILGSPQVFRIMPLVRRFTAWRTIINTTSLNLIPFHSSTYTLGPDPYTLYSNFSTSLVACLENYEPQMLTARLPDLITASIDDYYSIGSSIRPICTRCCFAMTDMIQC